MDIVSRTSHPTLPGVEQILYRLPKKDPTGTPIPGQFQSTVHRKTVFDPSLISIDEFIRRGVEAANNSTSFGSNGTWISFDNDGSKWIGYIDGLEITTFWPYFPKN